MAEPEQDGDHRFWQCLECGYAFGYRRIPQAPTGDTCAIGIPEDVRRVASAPMQHTLTAAQPTPLLTIGRRPDAPSA